MKKKIQSDSTPLIIAIGLLLISGYLKLFINVEVNNTHLFGAIGVVISIIAYFSDKTIYRYFFGLFLVMGLLGYLDVAVFDFSFSFGNWLSIDLTFVFLSIFYLFFTLIGNKK